MSERGSAVPLSTGRSGQTVSTTMKERIAWLNKGLGHVVRVRHGELIALGLLIVAVSLVNITWFFNKWMKCIKSVNIF